MIEQVRLQNFQSHEDTKLNFEPGVNVIIGQSDSGKSAIIRAIRWAIWNRPLGDSFRSHWGGDTAVTIETNDCSVERFKGKKDHYTLNNLESEELKFQAFGTEPPEEVTEALALSELNVQDQMDSPFLLSNNPGEVSRHFNKIANIDQIDSALKAVESWLRSYSGKIKSTDEEIERYEGQLEDFEYLDKMEAQVEVLESMENKFDRLLSSQRSIERLITQIEGIDEDIEEFEELLSAEEQVDQILSLMREKRTYIGEYKRVKSLCLSIIETLEGIKEHTTLTSLEEPVEMILGMYGEQKEIKEDYRELKDLIEDIEQIESNLEKQQHELTTLEQNWHDEMPDICPLCGKEQ